MYDIPVSFYRNFNGAGEGTRTPNILFTKQVLCQLSYTSRTNSCYRSDLNREQPAYEAGALTN